MSTLRGALVVGPKVICFAAILRFKSGHCRALKKLDSATRMASLLPLGEANHGKSARGEALGRNSSSPQVLR
jgi:hypothetical protein